MVVFMTAVLRSCSLFVMSRPPQSPGADRCSDVMQRRQVKVAAWCSAGEYRACFNAPLEPFCLDKCPFSNHMRAEDD